MDQLSKEILTYARAYQETRHEKSDRYDGLFPPLELLVDRQTAEPNLSVSFSGSAGSDIYITRRASLIRAVKVTTRWFFIPWTVAKVLKPSEFESAFAGMFDSVVVDGEPHWILRRVHADRVKKAIHSLAPDEEFRAVYEHHYLPEADPSS